VIPSWRDVLLFIALGATGLAGFNVFVVLAVADADPSAVGVIIEGAPIVLALAGPLLSRAAPSTRLVLAACVVTAGAGLVEGVAGSTTSRGLVLSFGGLVCEVAFSVLAAPIVRRIPPIGVSMYACVAATGLLFAAALVAGVQRPTLAEAGVVLYQGVATPIALVAWYVCIQRCRSRAHGHYCRVDARRRVCDRSASWEPAVSTCCAQLARWWSARAADWGTAPAC